MKSQEKTICTLYFCKCQCFPESEGNNKGFQKGKTAYQMPHHFFVSFTKAVHVHHMTGTS